MNRQLRTALRWLLPVPVLAISMMVAMILLMSSMIVDRPFLSQADRLGVDASPSLLLGPLHLSVTLVIALVLVVPFALTAALPLRTRPMSCLPWGIAVAALLLAAFVWFVPTHGAKLASKWAAASTVAVVIVGGILAILGSRSQRKQFVANILGISILFIPALTALARPVNYPSKPAKLWSVVLQKQEWQGINTSSEYSATRQIVFASDRVVAVFDTGPKTYPHPGQTGNADNWPLSTYALVSLDRITGTKKNELQIAGRWGSMPYIYADSDERIDMQSIPPRILNPDLTLADTAMVGPSAAHAANTDPIPATSKCVLFPDKPPTEQTLNSGCTTIQIADSAGKIVTHQPVVDEFGEYAGISKDGSRFALESYDSEGDPSFLLYEHFTIYDGHTGAALAMIPIKNLPDRQSWSAFSPDGRYFAVGNPNDLSLYRIP